MIDKVVGADRELEIGFQGPALAANRFVISVGSGLTRIAFLEQAPSMTDPAFRAAVLLTASDALQLADVLKQLLGQPEQPASE